MSRALKQARRSLERGRGDEALVVLWNELEAARLRGDAGALREIEAFAGFIARADETNAREAERLLEQLRGPREEEELVEPATQQLEGEVEIGGEPVDAEGAPAPAEAEEQPRRGRIGQLVWLVILVAVLLYNVLSGDRR